MPAKFTNNAFGTLASSINNSVTTISLAAGNGARFPSLSSGEFFYATLVDSSNNLEIVKVTARSTDTLTVTRGQDGTTGRAYSAGDRIELRPVAAALTNMVQLDGDQTIAGAKTFSGAVSCTSTLTGGTLSLNSSNPSLKITDSDTGSFCELISYDAGGGLRPSAIRVSNDGTGGSSDIMSWTSSNVGIGVNNPSTKLHVNGSAPQLRLSDSSTGSFVQLTSYDAGGGLRPAAIRVSNDGTGGTTDVMTLTSSGNVGIGTSSPAGNSSNRYLSLNGSALSGIDFRVGGSSYSFLRSESVTLQLGTSANIPIQIFTNGTERIRINADGSQTSVIPGGSTPYPSFTARAWVNFNGTGTVAIRASGNVSSITDLGVGAYRVNFASAMPDANYAATVFAQEAIADSGFRLVSGQGTPSTSSMELTIRNQTNSFVDAEVVGTAVFR